MAKNQIKNLRINVSTDGGKDAHGVLKDINSEIQSIQENAKKLGGFLSGPIKTMENLYSRSKSAASVFADMAKAASKMNTSLNGGTVKATKDISAYMDNMELVSLTLLDVTKNATLASTALGKVNMATGPTAATTALEDLHDSLIDIVVELKEMNVGSRVTTRRLKELRDAVTDTGVYANRTNEELEGMSAAMRGVGTSSDKLNPKIKETDNNMRRLNGSGSQGARAFSSMAFGMNPLTTLYAKLAINIYALSEAFRVMGEFSDTSRLMENLSVLSAQAGVNLSALSKEMQQVSGDSLSLAESSRLAARSVAQGFSSKQMVELTKNAKRASIALGINFSDAMDRLTKGIAKQEVELLDELGIVTRLEPAMKKYAESVGKTVDQLTDAERTTSLYIEANRQLRDSFGEVNIEATGLEVFTKAIASAVSLVGQAVVKELNPAMRKAGDAINKAMADGTLQAKEFAKAADETIKSVNSRGSSGDVANAFRLGTILSDGIDALEAQKKAVKGVLDEEKRLEAQIIDAQTRINNHRKNAPTPEIGEERANRVMFIFRDVGDQIIRNQEQVKTATESLKIYEEKISEITNKLGLQGYSTDTLRQLSMEFKTLGDSTTATTQNFGKWTTSLVDTRGPLNLVVTSLRAAATQYDTLTDKVKDNPTLYQDLFRLEKETLADINKQFDTQFVSLDTALDYVEELNVELYSFSSVLQDIGNTKGLGVLDVNRAKLAAITDMLDRNGKSMVATTKAALESQQAQLKRAIEIEEATIKLTKLSREQELTAMRAGSSFSTEASILAKQKESRQAMFELTVKVQGLTGEALETAKLSNKFEQDKLDILIKQASVRRALEVSNASLDRSRSAISEVQSQRDFERAKVGAAPSVVYDNESSQLEQSADIGIKAQQLAEAEASGTFDPEKIAAMKQELEILNNTLIRTKELMPRAEIDDWKAGMESIASIPGLDTMTSELISASASMGEALFNISESFANNNANMMENVGQAMQAGAEIAANVMGSLSDAKVADIDRQIAAETKRDGKSAESLAKIKKLEAKKIKEKAKSDKAQVVMSTAVAVIRAFADLGWPAGIPAAAIAAASGAFQLSQIDKAANGSMASLSSGPGGTSMSITGGNRDNSIDLSKSANAGEYAFLSGAAGQGSAQDFNVSGRVSGGTSEAGTSVLVGERGPEMITPQIPINVASAGESSGRGQGLVFAPVFNASSVDSSGMADLFRNYSKELYDGLEAELNADTRSLKNLG